MMDLTMWLMRGLDKMNQEIRLEVKPNFVNKYKSGYPLILKEAMVNSYHLSVEGSMIKLVDGKGQWIGRGYYGKQNKGIGWVLSQSADEKINDLFFKKKIKQAIAKREKFFA